MYSVLRPSSNYVTSPLPSRTSAGPTPMTQGMTNTWIGWPLCSTYRCLGYSAHSGVLTLSTATGLPSTIDPIVHQESSWDRS